MRACARAALSVWALSLAACASTGDAETAPDTAEPAARPDIAGTAPAIAIAGAVLTPVECSSLPGWSDGGQARALDAFLATCARFDEQEGSLNPPYAGTASSWRRACAVAGFAPLSDDAAAREFIASAFQAYFLEIGGSGAGFTTAYFEPELEARRVSEPPFVEPILAAPDRDAARTRTRAEIYAELDDYRAIAWGRASDVAFLHIQGSGRLRFADGSTSRAAFAAHNGRDYRSILRILIDRGALDENTAENDDVRAWLDRAPLEAARGALEENERYIFFAERPIANVNAGPVGAAGVALTPEASMAVDPAHHPYGTLYWIAPEGEGAPPPRLAVAQDTGAAIRGPLRSDLFFGAGMGAQARADAVEHATRWWAILPRGALSADEGA